MFEEELKLQRESSFVIPLVLVLVAVIVGAIGYWVIPSHSLSQPQAAGLVSAYLSGQGPATVHFHVGVLQPSVAEKIRDPHYRLLEKAGILKLGPAKGDAVSVAFTPDSAQARRHPRSCKDEELRWQRSLYRSPGGTAVGGGVEGHHDRPRHRLCAIHVEVGAE